TTQCRCRRFSPSYPPVSLDSLRRLRAFVHPFVALSTFTEPTYDTFWHHLDGHHRHHFWRTREPSVSWKWVHGLAGSSRTRHRGFGVRGVYRRLARHGQRQARRSDYRNHRRVIDSLYLSPRDSRTETLGLYHRSERPLLTK